MPRYLLAGQTQYVLNTSPTYHVAQDDVSTPLQRLEVEQITGHQFIRGRGGVNAVLYKTHWAGLSEPSWRREMDLHLSRSHVLRVWAGIPDQHGHLITSDADYGSGRHSSIGRPAGDTLYFRLLPLHDVVASGIAVEILFDIRIIYIFRHFEAMVYFQLSMLMVIIGSPSGISLKEAHENNVIPSTFNPLSDRYRHISSFQNTYIHLYQVLLNQIEHGFMTTCLACFRGNYFFEHTTVLSCSFLKRTYTVRPFDYIILVQAYVQQKLIQKPLHTVYLWLHV